MGKERLAPVSAYSSPQGLRNKGEGRENGGYLCGAVHRGVCDQSARVFRGRAIPPHLSWSKESGFAKKREAGKKGRRRPTARP